MAGRNEKAIGELAAELDLEFRIFDLNPHTLDASIAGMHLVLHCAGPFIATAEPMIDACIRCRIHYLDITGEINVFEMAKAKHREAAESGILVLPGAGFDVVPTDCISLHLKNRLPNATHLNLAFVTVNGGLSHGTASTMVGSLGSKGFERVNGELKKVPVGKKFLEVFFEGHRFFMMSIPWGDVSTAYTSTGIPNIVTYTGVPVSAYKILRFQFLFNWILRTRFFRRAAARFVKRRIPSGPSVEIRKKARSFVFGEVTNSKNEKVSARLSGPDGYTMTAETSLLIAQKILSGQYPPGYHTPASLFGENLILEIPGVSGFT